MSETNQSSMEDVASPVLPVEQSIQPENTKVSIISPKGEVGTIEGKELSAALANGFRLPGYIPKPSDFTDQGAKLKVISPTGEAGTVSVHEYGALAKNGFKLESQGDHPQADAAHQAKVASISDILSAKDTDALSKLGGSKENVQDEQGNYKMLSPNGEKVNIPPNQLQQHLDPSRGFKFQDDDFQSLYDAQLALGHEKGLSAKSGEAAASGYVGTIPAFDWLRDKLTTNSDSMFGKAWNIANRQLEQTTQRTAHGVGTLAGAAAQLAIPGGLFGEVKAGSQAATGVLKALAPEGAGIAQQLLAKGVAGAVEGAIISAPQAIAKAAIEKDPAGAVESLMLGAGLGSLLHIAPSVVNAARGVLNENALEKASTLPGEASKLLETAGADVANLSQTEQTPLARALIEQVGDKAKPSAELIEQSFKKLAGGEHLTPELNKLDSIVGKVDNNDLIQKVSQYGLGAAGASSAAANEEVINLTKAIESADSLSKLQKVASEVEKGINWKSVGDEINQVRAQAHTDIMDKIFSIGDENIAQAGAKAVSNWAENKSIIDGAKTVLQNFNQELATNGTKSAQSMLAFLTKQALPWVAGTAAGGATHVAAHAIPGGSLVSLVAGTAARNAAKSTLSPILEKFIDNSPNRWLNSNKFSENAVSFAAIDAIKANEAKLAEIPDFIRNLTVRTPAVFSANQNPIKEILGTEANGLSKDQQFKRLANKTSTLAGNPELMNQHVSQSVSPFAKNHPELADQMTQDFNNKVLFIHQLLNSKNTNIPQAFQKQKDYVPSKNDLKDMEDQLKIAQNPYALLDGLKNGTVTSKQVAVAAQLNPAILSNIRDEINKEAYSGKSNLSYQQRLSASIVMGQPMDNSLKNVQQLQSTFALPQQQAAPPSGGKHGGHKMNTKNLPSNETLGQRLQK